LAEIEYPDAMQVRTVKSHGHFRWKRHDVFLSEVLWGEPVGLLRFDDGCYTVYFAHMPVALFDERTRKTHRLPTGKGMKTKRKNKTFPIREKCQACARSKMSGMSPAVQFPGWILAKRKQSSPVFRLRERG
jgi:hypothetical protein